MHKYGNTLAPTSHMPVAHGKCANVARKFRSNADVWSDRSRLLSHTHTHTLTRTHKHNHRPARAPKTHQSRPAYECEYSSSINLNWLTTLLRLMHISNDLCHQRNARCSFFLRPQSACMSASMNEWMSACSSCTYGRYRVYIALVAFASDWFRLRGTSHVVRCTCERCTTHTCCQQFRILHACAYIYPVDTVPQRVQIQSLNCAMCVCVVNWIVLECIFLNYIRIFWSQLAAFATYRRWI